MNRICCFDQALGWLEGVDRNTKYFHGNATQKQAKLIEGLRDDDNGVWAVWHQDENVITGLLVDFYSKLFETDPQNVD